jgi:superfamily II DNA or RNA helicase
VVAKLIGASRETKLLVSSLLSYEVEGFEHSSSFRSGSWDGRSSFYDYKTSTFPAGFVHMIAKALINAGHRVQFAIKETPLPLGPDIGTYDPLGYGFTERYDYQPDTVRKLLRTKRMIARIATGGGKSNIATLATVTIKRPTLFLTTRSVLMHQMAAAYTKAGIIPGVLGDGVWAPRKGVNVGMVQTLAARLAKPNPEDSAEKQAEQRKCRELTLALLSYFEFVIGEEAHESGGTSYYEIMQACRNAHYRLALTATPFMRDSGEANMRLQGAFGSIGIEVSEKTLIERGILATPYFKFHTTPGHRLMRRGTRWPACYDLGVVENGERNLLLVSDAIKASQHGLPAMFLVQREKHGELLNHMLSDAGLQSAFVFGKHEQADRREALTDLGTGKLNCLIGSTIFDVGVDVPAVGLVGIAGAGKAEVGHRQRIGRGLREKKTGANVCFISDFSDEANNTLHEHALTRLAIVKNTPGFVERLLKPGEDFPYHIL